MNDETRLALDDAETPVNPYSLLAAVNASAQAPAIPVADVPGAAVSKCSNVRERGSAAGEDWVAV